MPSYLDWELPKEVLERLNGKDGEILEEHIRELLKEALEDEEGPVESDV